ncbi:MAG: hypothetical protein R3B45_17880 [Bdellovibrionota bacterium]
MFRKTVTVIISFTLLSCTTMTAKYSANVTVHEPVDKNRTKMVKVYEVEYEKSSDTTWHAVACGVTGIFYGGWCWAYLAMPMAHQERNLAKQAENHLRQKVHKDSELTFLEVTYKKTGWSHKNESFTSNLVAETREKLPQPVVSESATPSSVNMSSIPKASKPSGNGQKLVKNVVKKEDNKPAQPQKKAEDLKNPLRLIGSEIKKVPGKYGRNFVSLVLTLKNEGSRRITAYKIKVLVTTKLGTKVGTFDLTSESSSIDSLSDSSEAYSWEDNQFIANETYDKLASISSENLVVRLLSQKVVKESVSLSH